MRKGLIALLMASTLVPAAAYAQDGGSDRGTRARAEHVDRSSQRDDDNDARSQRAAQRQERQARPERAERQERPDRPDRQADRAPNLNQSSDLERAMRSDRMQRAERPTRGERPQRVEQDVQDSQPAQQVQAPANVQRRDGRPDSLIDGFRQVARGENAGRDNDHHDRDWKNDWRKDKRYDWSSHRSRYSSLYRLGRYSDPYGWGYRRWTAGYSLWPSYYGSNYWLNDPWMYRLPPAYGPYRWVRYYDDALLVNIYTGYVVDTIYNFFW